MATFDLFILLATEIYYLFSCTLGTQLFLNTHHKGYGKGSLKENPKEERWVGSKKKKWINFCNNWQDPEEMEKEKDPKYQMCFH